MAIPNEERKYSYADYLMWDEGERVELIDGEIFNMSLAPSRHHQRVLGELSRAFSTFLQSAEYEVYFAPFDVRLFAEDKKDADIDNVVQPDLSVVCDKDKLVDKGCNGSPDKYELQGVFTEEDTVSVHILPELTLNLNDIFDTIDS